MTLCVILGIFVPPPVLCRAGSRTVEARRKLKSVRLCAMYDCRREARQIVCRAFLYNKAGVSAEMKIGVWAMVVFRKIVRKLLEWWFSVVMFMENFLYCFGRMFP